MSSLTSLFLSTNNLIIHASTTILLTLLFNFLKIPSLYLHSLHTYIHPDDVSPNANTSGVRAAIRRPGANGDDQPRPRKKSKERFDFDESKAQIFRLKLDEGHLQSRIYFKEFYGAFNFCIAALSSLLLHRFLNVNADAGFVRNGTVIPLLLGLVGFCRLSFLIVKVCSERSASKKTERLMSFVLGILGFLFGSTVVLEIVPKGFFDFEFESLDGFGRFLIAAYMGFLVGVLYIPALRNARGVWLGTDQIRCNLSIISCGWFSRMILYADYLIVTFTSLLWIKPFEEFLFTKNVKQGVVELVGHIGMSRSNFENFRLWCLLITGIVQFLAIRPNVQMFLNEAVLSWYQRLHASKIPDLDYSRAKVFLHNHYLCLVAIQIFFPSTMVLLLLGLSRLNGTSLFSFTPYRDVALFMAWWVVFVWAVLNTAILAMYRRGTLYIS